MATSLISLVPKIACLPLTFRIPSYFIMCLWNFNSYYLILRISAFLFRLFFNILRYPHVYTYIFCICIYNDRLFDYGYRNHHLILWFIVIVMTRAISHCEKDRPYAGLIHMPLLSNAMTVLLYKYRNVFKLCIYSFI